ncbi:MAG: ATP-grasp domain-containing protein [Hyphomicrobiales bacterium]
MLIAAISGRALAIAAREAGYAPLVADLFGDQDMRAAAIMSTTAPGNLESGFDEQGLIDSLTRLAAGRTCEGLVCGSGFEDRPEILAQLAQIWPLLGNSADTVRRAKDPFGFARLCAKLDVPHPPVRETCPSNPRNWLGKRIGGSGGAHVQAAGKAAEGPGTIYYQRRVAGRAVSALFLADGEDARVLGFSAQWSDPAPHAPERYGGAVRPAGIGQRLRHRLVRYLRSLAPALGLRGLNGADFLISGEDAWLIEINPRPGATLDLFDAASLFALHVDACRGALPAQMPRFPGAAAAAIAYAPRRISQMPQLDWPDWSADRQTAGSSVCAGEPLCTIKVKARSTGRAKALIEERIKVVLALAQGGRS